MLREFAVQFYLFIFQLLFNSFKLFSLKRKSVFIASLGHNVSYVAEQLKSKKSDHIVILKTRNCQIELTKNRDQTVLIIDPMHPIQFVRAIFHLATSHRVFVDNYYGFLAVTSFKESVICVQLWHAAGAIKQFGLKDLSIEGRSEKAHERFRQVYNRFDYVVVGSDKMATIFEEGFGLTDERILRTGIPRTDFFFDDIKKKNFEKKLLKEIPNIDGKKIILYAPTYRDDELDSPQLHIELDKMYKQLRKDYVLFLRLHPAVNGTFENKHPGFVYNLSSHYDVNELLIITDILITDYSSIPFEYALLNRPMIFYAYDLEDYAEKRGFWENYYSLVPGEVVKTTDELIDVIKRKQFNLEQITQFSNEWNKYSTGQSSKQLVDFLYD